MLVEERSLTGGGGMTTFYDDVIHNGDEIRTFAGARTVFLGNQSGAGNFTGTGVVEYAGDLRPGNSPANVSYEGDVFFNSSAGILMELGGTTPGSQFDRLSVAGSASLDGDLDVSLTNGFTPNGAQQFTILTAGSINGTFDSTNLPALAGGLFFNLAYSPTAVTLSVAGILGDYNLNGVVDAADFVVWRKALGQVGGPLAADGNGNGQIDSGDLTVWRTHFGQIAGSGSGASANAAVPEPTTFAMLIVVASGVCLPRRRAA